MRLIGFLFLSSVLSFSAETLAQTPKSTSITQDAEDYRWLYEILFTESQRQQAPAETFKSFKVHLLDSDQNFPDPALIGSSNLEIRPQIRGTMTYVGIFKRRYAYDVVQAGDGTVEFHVRVHLKDGTAKDWQDFTTKVHEAQEIWDQNQVPMDFKYCFRFELVQNPSQALFSVRVLDSTSGPYDTAWSRDWTGRVIAHEIGHMLGLGDEYRTGTSTFDCYRPALMCDAWKGGPMAHHYYFILRRLIGPQ